MTAVQAPHAVSLRTERRVDPVGIGGTPPWLSWELRAAESTRYTGFQVQAAADAGFADVQWDSGRRDHPAAGLRYEGPALTSRQGVHWRVRAFAQDGQPGPWSIPSYFETGLLDPADWVGEWIGIADDRTGTPVHLATTFTVPVQTVRARVYATALGWMRLFVDGVDLTDGVVAPGFTPYDDEVEYLTFNLDGLSAGDHSLDIVVADGRFRGALGIHGVREVYGDRIGALAQLEFELADGSVERVGTGPTWTGGHGPRTFADPKDGETIDLTRAERGHTEKFTIPSEVVVLASHPRTVVAPYADPLRQVRTLDPQTITTQSDGSVLVDFGQNIAGVVRVRTAAAAGTRLSIQHGEDLGPDGRLEWEHLDRQGEKRSDRPRRFQRDEIIADGHDHWVQPWFTLHGFRYVEVSGLPDPSALGDIQAVVMSAVEVDHEGFASSDERLNRLYSNAMWSMTGNFLDTPTDCPQRERGGFTGDIQIFAPTATAVADVTGYLTRYLRSLRIDQLDDGRVPMIVPKEYSEFSGPPKGMTVKASGSVGWGDAAVLLPWSVYEATGDVQILRDQLPSMIAWVEYLRRGGARKGFIWGEWIRAGESSMLGAARDNSVNRKNIGLAYLAHSARLLSDIARIVGNADQADEYAAVSREATASWRRTAVRRGGHRVGTDRQDDYVRALAFDLLTPSQRTRAAARLAALVERTGHIGTGFLSTALLLPTLASVGRRDLAYRLLLQETPPSWLGQVAQGATTIWENWEEPGRKGRRVGSSNHYAFGSVASWLISGVVGLSSETPGRHRVRFAPRPGGGLTHARASLQTEFGPVVAGWETDGRQLVVRAEVPVGVTVIVEDGDQERTLGHGSHKLELAHRDA